MQNNKKVKSNKKEFMLLFFLNFSIVLLYCIAFINISVIFFSQIFYCNYNYLLKLVLTAKQYNKSLVNLLVGYVLLFAKFFVYFDVFGGFCPFIENH